LGDGRPRGRAKAEGKEIGESPVSAENLGALARLIVAGDLSGKLAKEVFAKMFRPAMPRRPSSNGKA